MVNQKELLENLNQFTGTGNYYKLYLQVILTDGTKYLMEVASCYWLGDIVLSYQTIKKVSTESFQVYKLKVNLENQTAVMTCDDGNGHILKRQNIEFTDFPLKEITLYYVDNILMLPSEY